MAFRTSEKKKLQEYFDASANSIVMVYGSATSGLTKLLREFTADKKCFYYKARQASAKEQYEQMRREVSKKYDTALTRGDYNEIFNRVKSGDPSKLVVVIDSFELIVKKDPEFIKAIVKLKQKKLYPGPVMIILATNSLVFAENDMEDFLEESARHIDCRLRLKNLEFLDVVRHFPELSVRECVKIYGVAGGVSDYLDIWDAKKSMKENICSLILDEKGAMHNAVRDYLYSELRELAFYETILYHVAMGSNKLNELFHDTGFSRAKILVYMKNLAEFDVVEKVVSFETGGWDNTKKGMYRIKDPFINFWFRFVYPNLSDLELMSPEAFYENYIAREIDEFFAPTFSEVCLEYLELMNKMGKLKLNLVRSGTWLGKNNKIDIMAADSERNILVGVCNWMDPVMKPEVIVELTNAMKKAKIKSSCIYFFSATTFHDTLRKVAERDERFTLVDMNEL